MSNDEASTTEPTTEPNIEVPEETAAKKPVKRTKAGPKSHAAEVTKEKVVSKPNPPRDPRGKKLKTAAALVEAEKLYPLAEAVALVGKTSVTKFDASVELHVRVSQEARGTVVYPKSTGKVTKVAVITPELIAELGKGKITFDVLLATPAQMPEIAKFARVLGPKGMMPNPKSGTVTNDIDKVKAELEAGRTEYRTDEGKNVHLVIGKVSSSADDLIANAQAALASLGAFGIRTITLSTTMGPGIHVAPLTE